MDDVNAYHPIHQQYSYRTKIPLDIAASYKLATACDKLDNRKKARGLTSLLLNSSRKRGGRTKNQGNDSSGHGRCRKNHSAQP